MFSSIHRRHFLKVLPVAFLAVSLSLCAAAIATSQTMNPKETVLRAGTALDHSPSVAALTTDR